MPRKRENKRRRGQTEADKVFLGLRAQLIEADPASFGLLPADRFPNVWGALMEQGMLPEQDEVRFNVLAYEGPRSASAPRADLEARSHPLGELFRTAHGVITELRLLQESGR